MIIKRLFQISIFFLLIMAPAKAEDIVILKTGEEVRGKIVSKTKTELKISVLEGSIKTYKIFKKEEVKSIKKGGAGEDETENIKNTNELKEIFEHLLELKKPTKAKKLRKRIIKLCIEENEKKYGNMVCEMCNGSTYTDCSVCSGKGRVKIPLNPNTQGAGNVLVCPVCNGAGQKKKPFRKTIKKDLTRSGYPIEHGHNNKGDGGAYTRDSAGTYIIQEELYIPCSRCKGSGTVNRAGRPVAIKTRKCTACIYGKVECESCEGTGGQLAKIRAQREAKERATQRRKALAEKRRRAKARKEAAQEAKEQKMDSSVENEFEAKLRAREKAKKDFAEKRERQKLETERNKENLAEEMAMKAEIARIEKGYDDAVKSGARLYLKRAKLKASNTAVRYEAIVQNTSPETIRTIEAVVCFYDESGNLIEKENSLITVQVLLSHAESKVKVSMAYTPGTYYATVKFNNSILIDTEIKTHRLDEKAYFDDHEPLR